MTPPPGSHAAYSFFRRNIHQFIITCMLVIDFNTSFNYNSMMKIKRDGMKELPRRKPNRLKDYDYNQNGEYFITKKSFAAVRRNHCRGGILPPGIIKRQIVAAYMYMTANHAHVILAIDEDIIEGAVE
jgi:hypothetical protein